MWSFSNRNPRPFAARTVLSRAGENVFDFFFSDVVFPNVRIARTRVDIVTNVVLKQL